MCLTDLEVLNNCVKLLFLVLLMCGAAILDSELSKQEIQPVGLVQIKFLTRNQEILTTKYKWNAGKCIMSK